MDMSNWEQWWLPNAEFLSNPIDDEFYSYIISPDCSSCDVANNMENNEWRDWNDDSVDTTFRTAYHMTSTLFGCQGKTKPMKDLRWDYDSYECPFGGRRLGGQYVEDGDLQYSVVLKSENETRWNTLMDLASTPSVAVKGLCGVFPYSTSTAQTVTTRDQCNDFTDAVCLALDFW